MFRPILSSNASISAGLPGKASSILLLLKFESPTLHMMPSVFPSVTLKSPFTPLLLPPFQLYTPLQINPNWLHFYVLILFLRIFDSTHFNTLANFDMILLCRNWFCLTDLHLQPLQLNLLYRCCHFMSNKHTFQSKQFTFLPTPIVSIARSVPNVSTALRVEFARGDGKVRRKEDERRRDIRPSDTLFVVNFHEETTKKADLEMLFGPFGQLIRIDMKGNYAFVQFSSIDEAMKAKDATNGGKLDRSVLTVEYVANQRGGDRGGGRRRGGGGWRGSVGGDRDRRRFDDRRRPPSDRYGGGGYEERHRRTGRDDRSYSNSRRDYDDYRRDRSPPSGGGYRRRSRSRSPLRHDRRDRSPPRYDRRDRSPPRYRDNSPPRGGSDTGGGTRYHKYRSDDRGRRGPSPAAGYRDRGYRP